MPTLAGTSGARLRHKRKRRARIESDSPGYKMLRKRLKELTRSGNRAEMYRLLSQMREYEVRMVARGIALPRALGGGAEATCGGSEGKGGSWKGRSSGNGFRDKSKGSIGARDRAEAIGQRRVTHDASRASFNLLFASKNRALVKPRKGR